MKNWTFNKYKILLQTNSTSRFDFWTQQERLLEQPLHCYNVVKINHYYNKLQPVIVMIIMEECLYLLAPETLQLAAWLEDLEHSSHIKR